MAAAAGKFCWSSARDALPFGGLQGGGWGVNAHLQAAASLDGHEAALEVHVGGLQAAQDGLRRVLRHLGLVSGLQEIGADDAPGQFHFPFLHAVRDGARHRQEVGDLLTLEPNALGVGGDQDVERFQPGVLDLILQIGGDLHQGLVDGSMLQAGDLDPRVHLLDAQRQAPGRLKNAEGQHALLPDARLLRVQLRDAVAGDDLEAHALLRHQQEGALLFARLAQDELRDRPGVGGLDARPGQADGELLLAFGLAGQVQRDHAPGVGLQLGPMTQRRSR